MTVLNINQIKQYLPHRYPFLMVDRVLHIKKNESIVAIKNVTVNEPFFNGHFPEQPVMPGVLMIEALAQTAGILIFESADLPKDGSNIFLLAGVDNTRFKLMVTPGDQLTLTATVEKARRDIWRFQTKAEVGDQLACSTELLIARSSKKNE